tara:strand:- start:12712 stop:14631 length:1920 start_codon:yes stop_codon:yes gene_type:complete
LLARCVQEYPDDPSILGLGALNAGYSVSVNVTGLQDAGLVLASGNASLTLSSSGTFEFSNSYPAGSSYNVVIQAVPAGYSCNISNATGTVNANVTNVQVDCLRAAVITPSNNSVLTSTQPIRIVFSRSMTGCTPDAAATPAPANLASDISATNLLTTNVANDTIEFTTAGWTTGSLRFLILNNCQSADGSVFINLTLNYLVASNVAYVATTGTDVGACGTVGTACATINYAIGRLVANGCNGTIDCAVLVAEGPTNGTAPYFRDTYNMGGSAITMSDRISLMGSYAADFSSRFPQARSSILVGNGSLCGSSSCHILVPGTVSATTLIDGFRIVGDESGALNSLGVQVNGAIRMTNNHIQAGNGSASRMALNLSGGGLSIINGNRIEVQGNTATSARAVVLNSGTADFYLNQILTNGAVSNATAITLAGGTGSIHTNGVYTGVANNTTGILINSTNAYNITNNLILADQALTGTSTGIHFLLALSGGAVINNMIIGNGSSPQSFCMRDAIGLPAAVDLDSNNLFGCPSGLMEDSGGIAYDTICDSGTSMPANRGTFGNATCAAMYADAGTKQNVSINPVFLNSGAGDFHYSASSPCLSAQGGVDPGTYGITVRPDADSQPRPGADSLYSIGLYEPTLGCL